MCLCGSSHSASCIYPCGPSHFASCIFVWSVVEMQLYCRDRNSGNLKFTPWMCNFYYIVLVRNWHTQFWFPQLQLSWKVGYLLFIAWNEVPGDVELTNMQLKPEALNALKLPVKVKAGFLGSVKIKVRDSCITLE